MQQGQGGVIGPFNRAELVLALAPALGAVEFFCLRQVNKELKAIVDDEVAVLCLRSLELKQLRMYCPPRPTSPGPSGCPLATCVIPLLCRLPHLTHVDLPAINSCSSSTSRSASDAGALDIIIVLAAAAAQHADGAAARTLARHAQPSASRAAFRIALLLARMHLQQVCPLRASRRLAGLRRWQPRVYARLSPHLMALIMGEGYCSAGDGNLILMQAGLGFSPPIVQQSQKPQAGLAAAGGAGMGGGGDGAWPAGSGGGAQPAPAAMPQLPSAGMGAAAAAGQAEQAYALLPPAPAAFMDPQGWVRATSQPGVSGAQRTRYPQSVARWVCEMQAARKDGEMSRKSHAHLPATERALERHLNAPPQIVLALLKYLECRDDFGWRLVQYDHYRHCFKYQGYGLPAHSHPDGPTFRSVATAAPVTSVDQLLSLLHTSYLAVSQQSAPLLWPHVRSCMDSCPRPDGPLARTSCRLHHVSVLWHLLLHALRHRKTAGRGDQQKGVANEMQQQLLPRRPCVHVGVMARDLCMLALPHLSAEGPFGGADVWSQSDAQASGVSGGSGSAGAHAEHLAWQPRAGGPFGPIMLKSGLLQALQVQATALMQQAAADACVVQAVVLEQLLGLASAGAANGSAGMLCTSVTPCSALLSGWCWLRGDGQRLRVISALAARYGAGDAAHDRYTRILGRPVERCLLTLMMALALGPGRCLEVIHLSRTKPTATAAAAAAADGASQQCVTCVTRCRATAGATSHSSAAAAFNCSGMASTCMGMQASGSQVVRMYAHVHGSGSAWCCLARCLAKASSDVEAVAECMQHAMRLAPEQAVAAWCAILLSSYHPALKPALGQPIGGMHPDAACSYAHAAVAALRAHLLHGGDSVMKSGVEDEVSVLQRAYGFVLRPPLRLPLLLHPLLLLPVEAYGGQRPDAEVAAATVPVTPHATEHAGAVVAVLQLVLAAHETQVLHIMHQDPTLCEHPQQPCQPQQQQQQQQQPAAGCMQLQEECSPPTADPMPASAAGGLAAVFEADLVACAHDDPNMATSATVTQTDTGRSCNGRRMHDGVVNWAAMSPACILACMVADLQLLVRWLLLEAMQGVQLHVPGSDAGSWACSIGGAGQPCVLAGLHNMHSTMSAGTERSNVQASVWQSGQAGTAATAFAGVQHSLTGVLERLHACTRLLPLPSGTRTPAADITDTPLHAPVICHQEASTAAAAGAAGQAVLPARLQRMLASVCDDEAAALRPCLISGGAATIAVGLSLAAEQAQVQSCMTSWLVQALR